MALVTLLHGTAMPCQDEAEPAIAAGGPASSCLLTGARRTPGILGREALQRLGPAQAPLSSSRRSRTPLASASRSFRYCSSAAVSSSLVENQR